MEPERWNRIERLYHAALEREPDGRTAFLTEACPDADVRREVESLLGFDGAGSVLERPAWEKSFRTGERVGPYEILDCIGEGGMGEVWKARDTRLGRTVAIKAPDARFSERFEREARAVAALNHPHICQLYDVGPNYLVMELIDGAPLHGPLPLDKAIEYAKQILEALDAAHKQGIVHRDLKPANILVTKTGVKLLDFGLAKRESATGATALTIEDTIAGTPEYMAPEQARGSAVNSRADIFAFGCVLYEMLTGKRAFEGPTTASVIGAILERPAPSIAAVAPSALDVVLQRCLAKDPEERWQSVRDLKAAITLAAESQPVAKPNRRAWIAGTAAGVVGGALAGGGAVAWLRRVSSDVSPLQLEIDPPQGGQFLTNGLTTTFALSPDGRIAAYTANVSGKAGLWIRPLGGGPPRIIADAGILPFWSPDNRSIAFVSGTRLQRVDLAAGAPWTVCDSPPDAIGGGAWSADGQILLGSQAGLLRVPASGGTPALLTTADHSHGERGHAWPQALPRGGFLYFAGNDRPENAGIYAASLARPAERVHLLSTNSNALYAPGGDGRDYLVWYRAGALVAQELDAVALKMRGEPRLIASPARVSAGNAMFASVSASGSLLYSASAGALSLLSWFNREGRSVATVGEADRYMTFRLSPDGARIAASRLQQNGTYEIRILEASRGAAIRFADVAVGGLSAWSPDGRALVYPSPDHNLFRQEFAGSGNPQRLTKSPHLLLPNDWSRDGRLILYQELVPGSKFDLMVLEIGSDGKPMGSRSWLNTPYNQSDGRFVPTANPRWVAYMSSESGRFEIYIDSFPEPRKKIRISIDGGRFPQWRGDGRELFFLSADYKLTAVDVKLGADSVETSAPRVLFALPILENVLSPYEAAPDGQRFLVRAAVQQSQPLTLIVNWPALLKGSPGR